MSATRYADAPVGLLSGGEQQRLRIAQALLGNPRVLLCDDPLLSLDLGNQQEVIALIDEQRRSSGTAVVFVTHEVNPVLPITDRVLYLVGGNWAIGKPEEVMTSQRLSGLYDALSTSCAFEGASSSAPRTAPTPKSAVEATITTATATAPSSAASSVRL